MSYWKSATLIGIRKVIERGYRLRLAQENGGLYVWVTDFEDIDKAAWGSVVDWQPGEWHHIAATWDEQRLSLYVDGRLLWGEALPFTIAGSPTTLAVGGSLIHGRRRRRCCLSIPCVSAPSPGWATVINSAPWCRKESEERSRCLTYWAIAFRLSCRTMMVSTITDNLPPRLPAMFG